VPEVLALAPKKKGRRVLQIGSRFDNNNNNKFQNSFNKNKLTSSSLRSMDGLSFSIFCFYILNLQRDEQRKIK